MSRYVETLNRKVREHGDKFSDKGLNPAFVDAFNKGQDYRVRVIMFPGAKPIWGFIGMTTGWVPSFLLMRRRGQHGSSDVIGPNSVIVGEKWMPQPRRRSRRGCPRRTMRRSARCGATSAGARTG